MKGKALIIGIGKGAGDDEEAPESGAETEAGDELATVLGNAFDAFKDDDRAGFIRSMRAAVKLGG